MTKSEWNHTQDVEALVRFAAEHVSVRELLVLATEYCQEVARLIPSPTVSRKLLEIARLRGEGQPHKGLADGIRSESGTLYQELYPGFGSPSPAALALTAIGELVFTEDALQAAITAFATAAEAKAVAEGSAVSDDQYDRIHDAEYRKETHRQASLIRSRIHPFRS